ncbi:MAG: ABC transporter ATP-binding protein [Oscillospiraceae bacterium]|nr:ABC transporter ATP-binding protein [Oscillospiraceae bacterium]
MSELKIDGLSCGYGGADIVKNVSLNVQGGETVAIAGPNGCGKTTLLRAVCGLIPITAGGVFIDGKSVAEISPKERAQKIAMLSQTGAGGDYFGYTVLNTVLMGRYSRQKGTVFSETSREDISAAERCIAEVGLENCEDRLITELSGGQLQRVFLARAFAQEPDILLLDEPANHLDIKSQNELAELLKRFAESGKAVVGVFHDISFAAAVSDRILLMKNGEAADCGNAEDIVKSEKLSEVFGTDIRAYMKKVLKIWE